MSHDDQRRKSSNTIEPIPRALLHPYFHPALNSDWTNGGCCLECGKERRFGDRGHQPPDGHIVSQSSKAQIPVKSQPTLGNITFDLIRIRIRYVPMPPESLIVRLQDTSTCFVASFVSTSLPSLSQPAYRNRLSIPSSIPSFLACHSNGCSAEAHCSTLH